MWLPRPVYEHLPQFWILLGLLFVANGLYIGIDFAISLASIAVGLVCCAFGVGVAVVRTRHRSGEVESEDSVDIIPTE